MNVREQLKDQKKKLREKRQYKLPHLDPGLQQFYVNKTK